MIQQAASSSPDAPAPHAAHGDVRTLALAALGVVFGDIGTSPLYALKECVDGEHGVAPDAARTCSASSRSSSGR